MADRVCPSPLQVAVLPISQSRAYQAYERGQKGRLIATALNSKPPGPSNLVNTTVNECVRAFQIARVSVQPMWTRLVRNYRSHIGYALMPLSVPVCL